MKSKIGLIKLAYYQRKWKDPYSHFWTVTEVFVPKPTQGSPLPCVLLSMRNGKSSTLARFLTIKEASKCFLIPQRVKVRLEKAMIEANHEADRLEADYKLLFAKRHLAEGGQIVRTDTGEVIAEAERFLREARGGVKEVIPRQGGKHEQEEGDTE